MKKTDVEQGFTAFIPQPLKSEHKILRELDWTTVKTTTLESIIYFGSDKKSSKLASNLYDSLSILPEELKKKWIEREIFATIDKWETKYSTQLFEIPKGLNALLLDNSKELPYQSENVMINLNGTITQLFLEKLDNTQIQIYDHFLEKASEFKMKWFMYKMETDLKNFDLPKIEELLDYSSLIKYYLYLLQNYKDICSEIEIKRPKEIKILKSNLTALQIEKLSDLLIREGYISDSDSIILKSAFGFGINKIEKKINWKKASNLAVYLIDNLCSVYNPNDLWSIGESFFEVKNMAQIKNAYFGNKNGNPKHFEKIDSIINEI